MNILVFDIQTIPDVDSGRRLYGDPVEMQKLTDEEVARVMAHNRSRETGNPNELLRPYLQKIVAISAVLNSGKFFKVGSLCEAETSESELIQRFFEILQRTKPTLISWNGNNFDLPVLHYRSLLHGVVAVDYWATDGQFRHNNYQNRFHERHTDLMDILAGYQGFSAVHLNELATFLGFPCHAGMRGNKVWETYLQEGIQAIRNYCEIKALIIYLIFLRFELIRGHINKKELAQAYQQLRDALAMENKENFNDFLANWQN